MRTAGEILLKTARGVIYVSPETSVYDALARMARSSASTRGGTYFLLQRTRRHSDGFLSGQWRL
jgi:CBS domain-containing protein